MAFTLMEPAIGATDGTNRVFQTSAPYRPGSVIVFLNGGSLVREYENGWVELGGNSFRLNEAPLLGDTVLVLFTTA